MSKLVRNEQRKLYAAFLNGIGIAAIGVGGLAQIASMVQAGKLASQVTISAGICAILGPILHWWGGRELRGLEE